MKQFTVLLTLFGFIFSIQLNAHPWKPDHYVIIETDCGLDDYRAINLALTSSNIRVLAIITSNGVINAQDGFYKVKSLLHAYHNEGLLVGLNDNHQQKNMNCKAANNFIWNKVAEKQEYRINSYESILNYIFEHFNEKITYINLSGFNTINSYFEKYPDKIDKVKEIVWTCNTVGIKQSFNYLLDTASYQSVVNKKMNVKFINGASFNNYTNDIIKEIGNQNTLVSKNIFESISTPDVSFAKSMYDESAIFYLLKKEIFQIENNRYTLDSSINVNKYYLILLEEMSELKNQVISSFSDDSSDYILDIQNIMTSSIEKFGKEEWNACVITSELHRHLGVYSLIGVKMGVRAREYFGAGVDELQVVSYAGLEPPFSCLNDGLQVSTGATLGHGLISVKENNKLPKAEFYYLGQKITISLKEEYGRKIAKEIKDLFIIYGLDSNIYWDLVRDLAIKYWSKWSRFDIFEIEIE